MASTIHLDPDDLVRAGKAFNLTIIKESGGFTVSWPQSPVTLNLHRLNLTGGFTFESMKIKTEQFDVGEAGVDAVFHVV